MAENTKMPPNQDQRQRTPQGDMSKPQKPGGAGSAVGNTDRSRQGMGGPSQPMPDMDQDRSRTERSRPNQDPTQEPDKDRVSKIDDDEENDNENDDESDDESDDEMEELDDADTTQTQRPVRGDGAGGGGGGRP